MDTADVERGLLILGHTGIQFRYKAVLRVPHQGKLREGVCFQLYCQLRNSVFICRAYGNVIIMPVAGTGGIGQNRSGPRSVPIIEMVILQCGKIGILGIKIFIGNGDNYSLSAEVSLFSFSIGQIEIHHADGKFFIVGKLRVGKDSLAVILRYRIQYQLRILRKDRRAILGFHMNALQIKSILLLPGKGGFKLRNQFLFRPGFRRGLGFRKDFAVGFRGSCRPGRC